MTDFSKKVKLIEPIDLKNLRIEKHGDSMICDVYFPLDSIPDNTWKRCFENEKFLVVINLQARMSISYDELVVTIPIDEINQEMLEKLKKLIDSTNRCIDEANQALKEQNEIISARKKREEEDIQKAKDRLKD